MCEQFQPGQFANIQQAVIRDDNVCINKIIHVLHM